MSRGGFSHHADRPSATPNFLNMAAYRFVPLGQLAARQSRLQDLCDRWQLKGTILLSSEGINLVVAGRPESIDPLIHELAGWPQLNGLDYRRSWSRQQPFHRMRVRIKREIITFRQSNIDPCHHTVGKISPVELRQWLDEDRPLTLLDVRNNYEIEYGTFEQAHAIGIDHFCQFPQATTQLPKQLDHEPVVMFCTGGIRCEKAGPWLERLGFNPVLQLDGGILKYFEQVGGAHFQGKCFVFDQRIAIDSELGAEPSKEPSKEPSEKLETRSARNPA